MSESETRAAFLTAALVLLVMPLLFVMGMGSLMLLMWMTGMESAGGLLLAISIGWGLVVMLGVILFARRLTRRAARV